VPCIERSRSARRRRHRARRLPWPALGFVLLAACGAPAPSPPPARSLPPVESRRLPPAPEAEAPQAALGAPAAPHSHAQLKLQAARRMLAANPDRTYDGPAPDPLLAIPVLEIELNADGSVRRIEVLRMPRQARDTVQVAIDSVRRAAPFGDVSRLPRPWKFTETFLFNDDRRFKPRTLE
jgi:hypothetical protein